MGTDLARRALARPDALTLTRRSLARFFQAATFNQDLSGWNVNNVNDCDAFCLNAGFTNPPTIPSFPGSCGNPGC